MIGKIILGLFLWALLGYGALQILIILYESGKGTEQRQEIERDEDREGRGFLPSPMGMYRSIFCLRMSVTLAFIVEGFRFGGGWPTILLLGLGAGSWFSLSPDRKWMKK